MQIYFSLKFKYKINCSETKTWPKFRQKAFLDCVYVYTIQKVGPLSEVDTNTMGLTEIGINLNEQCQEDEINHQNPDFSLYLY